MNAISLTSKAQEAQQYIGNIASRFQNVTGKARKGLDVVYARALEKAENAYNERVRSYSWDALKTHYEEKFHNHTASSLLSGIATTSVWFFVGLIHRACTWYSHDLEAETVAEMMPFLRCLSNAALTQEIVGNVLPQDTQKTRDSLHQKTPYSEADGHRANALERFDSDIAQLKEALIELSGFDQEVMGNLLALIDHTSRDGDTRDVAFMGVTPSANGNASIRQATPERLKRSIFQATCQEYIANHFNSHQTPPSKQDIEKAMKSYMRKLGIKASAPRRRIMHTSRPPLHGPLPNQTQQLIERERKKFQRTLLTAIFPEAREHEHIPAEITPLARATSASLQREHKTATGRHLLTMLEEAYEGAIPERLQEAIKHHVGEDALRPTAANEPEAPILDESPSVQREEPKTPTERHPHEGEDALRPTAANETEEEPEAPILDESPSVLNIVWSGVCRVVSDCLRG